MNKQQTFEELIDDLIDNTHDVTPYANLNCKHCHGVGGKTEVDWVDYGNTTVSMPSFEICNCIYESTAVKIAVIKALVVANFDTDEISELIVTLQK